MDDYKLFGLFALVLFCVVLIDNLLIDKNEEDD